MRERKQAEAIHNSRRRPTREEKLLDLLRAARAPQPSPEYLAAFWPRLREKLVPRRPAILHPLYYGGLAAAAAALVLWVSLGGPAGTGSGISGSPVYTLATASSPAAVKRPEVNYISGPARRTGEHRREGVDYILPGIAAGSTGRLEV